MPGNTRHQKGAMHVENFKAPTRPSIGATALEYGLIAAGISVAIIDVVSRSRRQTEHCPQRQCRTNPAARSIHAKYSSSFKMCPTGCFRLGNPSCRTRSME
ncbi:Flp family type IVb pilin [Rhodoplanes sp. Z2-YC6860]|uniref:Flp family type IVb pilin n=1 Tax=Rhodoplanes sp. Z2-YC6860 TaxID=674703 RepID=UPI003FA7567A